MTAPARVVGSALHEFGEQPSGSLSRQGVDLQSNRYLSGPFQRPGYHAVPGKSPEYQRVYSLSGQVQDRGRGLGSPTGARTFVRATDFVNRLSAERLKERALSNAERLAMPPLTAWEVLKARIGTVVAPSDWSASHDRYALEPPEESGDS